MSKKKILILVLFVIIFIFLGYFLYKKYPVKYIITTLSRKPTYFTVGVNNSSTLKYSNKSAGVSLIYSKKYAVIDETHPTSVPKDLDDVPTGIVKFILKDTKDASGKPNISQVPDLEISTRKQPFEVNGAIYSTTAELKNANKYYQNAKEVTYGNNTYLELQTKYSEDKKISPITVYETVNKNTVYHVEVNASSTDALEILKSINFSN